MVEYLNRPSNDNIDSNIANLLVLLSQGGEDHDHKTSINHKRVFDCKTCSKQFSSFQALGGHRASHKKPRLADDDRSLSAGKPKVHECSVCGLEFAIGQALGGHMRRHRVIAAPSEGFGVVERKSNGNGKRVLSLDLSLAPPGSDVERLEHRELGCGLGLGLGLRLDSSV